MLGESSNPFVFKIKPMKVFLLVFILFFYIYGVNFTFLPVHTSRLILLAAFIYFTLKFFFKPRIEVENTVLIAVFLYVVYFNWVFLISGFQQLKDVTILANTLLLFVHTLVGGIFFSTIFHKMNFTLRDAILFIQIVIFIQAVFIFIYFLSWDFREFTFNYIPETGNIDHRETLYRSRGLTHSSGSTLSVLQSIGLLFTAYLISTVSYRSKQFFYLILSFGFLVVSIGLTGRTGLFMLPVVLTYLLFLLMMKNKLPKNITYFAISIPLVLIASYFILKYGYFALLGDGDAAVFDRLVKWYVDEFFGEGQVQSRTIRTILHEHWFLPDDLKTFYLGDPSTWSVNRIPSDAGLVRRMHGVGLFGGALIYVLYLIVFLYIVVKSRGVAEKGLFALLGLFLLIIELKEPMITHLSIAGVYLMIFSYFLLENHSGNLYNKKFISGES